MRRDERWGFKEVRLGAAEAMILRWLYPRAIFLLLTRHPFECYLSLSDARCIHFYYRRPDVQIDSPARFARFGNNVVVSWSMLPSDFPCFRKYEDLVGGHFDFRGLESWLGVLIAETSRFLRLSGAHPGALGWRGTNGASSRTKCRKE